MRCPKCNSLRTKKNGTKILVSGNRTQEFRCADCHRYFSIQINVNVLHELKSVEPGDILEIDGGKRVRIHGLTDIQADAILQMQLRRLTALEADKIRLEHEDLVSKIADFKDILGTFYDHFRVILGSF